jgi:hypothetical protein
MKMHYGRSVIVALAMTFLMGGVCFSQPPGPSDAMIKEAFQEIKAAADTNKDGKLTVAECLGIYKDRQLGEKNCKYWDVNRDGAITEAEYVAQAKKLRGK